MRVLKILCALPLIALLTMGNSGCDQNYIPTTDQIEYFMAKNMQHCPKVSHGKLHTERQRAKWVAKINSAYLACYGKLEANTASYKQYRAALERYKKG